MNRSRGKKKKVKKEEERRFLVKLASITFKHHDEKNKNGYLIKAQNGNLVKLSCTYFLGSEKMHGLEPNSRILHQFLQRQTFKKE